MIRVIFFLIAIGLIASGAVWLADRPGDVSIVWMGLRIDTSVMVLAAAVAAVAAAAVLVWSVLRLVLRSPGMASRALRRRRRRRGRRAISRGLIAIGAGDARAAKKFSGEAERLAASEPLALLLRAQTAQLQGDRAGAEAAFGAMVRRSETKLLGLRGLYVEAQRRDDPAAARQAAEAAAKADPALPWAGQAVLEFRCADRDWDGAIEVLEGNMRGGGLDKSAYRRLRAVLLTARALEAEEAHPGIARMLAIEAAKLAPDLVPAAALAGRLLADAGEPRKAAKILEAAWRKSPHPDLAETYAHLRLADSARDRLKRVQSLAARSAGDVEGAVAVARAALDAQEFAIARTALEPLLGEPSQRVAMLMADLEEAEHGDVGRAREWMARAVHAARDPAWTADGFVSERWLPVSPVSGRLDAFAWKVPLEEISPRPAIEEHAAAPAAIAAPAAPRETGAHGALERRTQVTRDLPPPVYPRTSAVAHPQHAVEPIIPLIHAPDDPGPDAEPSAEPEPAPGSDAWRRLSSLFR